MPGWLCCFIVPPPPHRAGSEDRMDRLPECKLKLRGRVSSSRLYLPVWGTCWRHGLLSPGGPFPNVPIWRSLPGGPHLEVHMEVPAWRSLPGGGAGEGGAGGGAAAAACGELRGQGPYEPDVFWVITTSSSSLTPVPARPWGWRWWWWWGGY